MKKLIITATLMLVAIMVFTSCVPKQDNKQQTTPKEVKLQYEYNMFCPGDILEFADIEITYADGDGTLITDTISAGQPEVLSDGSESTVDFHANIKINVVPTRLYLTFRYLPKTGIDFDTDKSVSTAATMYFSTVNADQVHDFIQPLEIPEKSVKASELKAYFDQFNANPPTLDYTLQEKNGIIKGLGLVKND